MGDMLFIGARVQLAFVQKEQPITLPIKSFFSFETEFEFEKA